MNIVFQACWPSTLPELHSWCNTLDFEITSHSTMCLSVWGSCCLPRRRHPQQRCLLSRWFSQNHRPPPVLAISPGFSLYSPALIISSYGSHLLYISCVEFLLLFLPQPGFPLRSQSSIFCILHDQVLIVAFCFGVLLHSTATGWVLPSKQKIISVMSILKATT